MSLSPRRKALAGPLQKVVIMLEDHDATGKVYAEINGFLSSKDTLIEAIRKIEAGNIYADEACTQLVDDEYIEAYRKIPSGQKDDEFVFLIDRRFAENHIVGARLVK